MITYRESYVGVEVTRAKELATRLAFALCLPALTLSPRLLLRLAFALAVVRCSLRAAGATLCTALHAGLCTSATTRALHALCCGEDRSNQESGCCCRDRQITFHTNVPPEG